MLAMVQKALRKHTQIVEKQKSGHTDSWGSTCPSKGPFTSRTTINV